MIFVLPHANCLEYLKAIENSMNILSYSLLLIYMYIACLLWPHVLPCRCSPLCHMLGSQRDGRTHSESCNFLYHHVARYVTHYSLSPYVCHLTRQGCTNMYIRLSCMEDISFITNVNYSLFNCVNGTWLKRQVFCDVLFRPPFPWPGILQCTTDPPGCPQDCLLPTPNILCPKTISEDCLFLNVFTPLTATPTSMLPVMAFFHGGNFIAVKI